MKFPFTASVSLQLKDPFADVPGTNGTTIG